MHSALAYVCLVSCCHLPFIVRSGESFLPLIPSAPKRASPSPSQHHQNDSPGHCGDGVPWPYPLWPGTGEVVVDYTALAQPT
jgi:hypothetical protein